MKVLIIEDDLSVTIDYEIACKAVGISEITIARDLKSIDEILETVSPDIVMLDIYIENKVSLELIPRFQEMGARVLIISAYPKDEFYKRAIDYKVDAFLSKPIDLNVIKYDLLKAKREIIEERKSQFVFHSGKNKISKIKIEDILYFETEGNYTSIYTKEKRYLLKKSLKNVSDGLNDKRFMRIFRNVIVNFQYTESVDFTSKLLTTSFGKTFQIGDKYKNQLKKYSKESFQVI